MQILSNQKKIRVQIRSCEKDFTRLEELMYELIEHQKRFQLKNEDEALLEWLTKKDEQKRIEN